MSPAEIARLPYRPGVGVMLLDRAGRVFVAQRIDMPSAAWQMPQGGIDEGESPRQAALGISMRWATKTRPARSSSMTDRKSVV
jgi:predicted NUDIX family NTP pyrophosphohydrolase